MGDKIIWQRAQNALGELERRAPDPGDALVTSHGDFHGGQLLELPGGPALIDARVDPSGYRRMLEIVRGAPK